MNYRPKPKHDPVKEPNFNLSMSGRIHYNDPDWKPTWDTERINTKTYGETYMEPRKMKCLSGKRKEYTERNKYFWRDVTEGNRRAKNYGP